MTIHRSTYRVNPAANGRLSGWMKAVWYELFTADGGWVDYKQLVETGMRYVPPGPALRAYWGRYNHQHDLRGFKTSYDRLEEDSLRIRSGAKMKVRSSISTSIRHGRMEIGFDEKGRRLARAHPEVIARYKDDERTVAFLREWRESQLNGYASQ